MSVGERRNDRDFYRHVHIHTHIVNTCNVFKTPLTSSSRVSSIRDKFCTSNSSAFFSTRDSINAPASYIVFVCVCVCVLCVSDGDDDEISVCVYVCIYEDCYVPGLPPKSRPGL